MSNVPEHYSKQKGENGNSIQGRVNLLVPWNSISVNNILKRCGEFVHLEEGGRLPIRMGLSEADNGGQESIEESNFLGGDPNFSNEDATTFLHQVESIEDDAFAFKDNLEGIKVGTLEHAHRHGLLKLFLVLLFCHNMKLFRFGEGIFNMLYFFKDIILVCWQLVPLCPKTITHLMKLGEHDSSCFHHTDEGRHGRALFTFFLLGDVEGVENAVSLGDPEDHFGEFVEIFVFDDAGHIDESEVVEGMLI